MSASPVPATGRGDRTRLTGRLRPFFFVSRRWTARHDLGRRMVVIELVRKTFAVVNDVPAPARHQSLQLSRREEERVRCRVASSVGDVNRGDEQPSRTDRLPDLLEQRAMEEVEVADQVVRVGLEAESSGFEIESASGDPAGNVPPGSLAHHALDADAGAVDRIDAPAALGEEKSVPASAAGQVERQPGSDAFDRRWERRRRCKVMQLLAAGELLVPAIEPLVHGAQRSRGSAPHTALVTRVQVDPSPANGRAIRCYEKAGLSTRA